MERDPDVIRVAEAMIRTYGGRTITCLAARAGDYLRNGDFENGRFWWRVALAVRALQQRELSGAG